MPQQRHRVAAQGQPVGNIILDHRLALAHGAELDRRLDNPLALQNAGEQRQGLLAGQGLGRPQRVPPPGGMGIGFLPSRAAREDAGLVEIMPPLPEWDAALWVVTHVDLHRSHKVQSFLAILKAQAADWSCD